MSTPESTTPSAAGASNPYVGPDGEYRPLEISDTALASPVYAAARDSWRYANAKDREAWLACWSPEGRIEDPVGPSFLDATGEGHHGPTGQAKFWDDAVNTPDHIEFRFDRAVLCGDELLCVGTVRTHMGENVMDAAGAVDYKVGPDGKLLAIRAFWEAEVAMATLRPADADSTREA